MVMEAGNTIVDPGLPTIHSEPRTLVPLSAATSDRMKAIVSAMDYAQNTIGYESGCLVVRGQDIGFISVG
jgi:hypothetical protein